MVVLMVCRVMIIMLEMVSVCVILNWNWLNIMLEIVLELVMKVFSVLMVVFSIGKVLFIKFVVKLVVVIGILVKFVLLILELMKICIIGMVNISIKFVLIKVLVDLLNVLIIGVKLWVWVRIVIKVINIRMLLGR